MKKLMSIMAMAFGLMLAVSAHADQQIEKIHFIIPGGAGGGWDGTARGTGEALTKSGIVGNATYENMSGGGGGKAIAYMIDNADTLKEDTIMVSSTPIIIRALTGVFPQSFRDLTPISGTIGDYAALVVAPDSDIQGFQDLVDIYEKDPKELAIAGGSVFGGMDHLVVAQAFAEAGASPSKVGYLPFDAGGEAMAALLSGEADALSTGLSEAIAYHKDGQARIIAITAPERIDAVPDAKTLKEQGVDMVFVNWRGFFGPPGLDKKQTAAYAKALGDVQKTSEWEDVRARNAWINIYNPEKKFVKFLENQEKVMGQLLKDIGFSK